MRVGIIGAGIAGLACAKGLARRGYAVVLFDKGRGLGGRMSTRRLATPAGEAHFDHGAQYFTARDPGFRAQVDSWIADGVAAAWPAAGDDAYVGVPAMNSPIRQLVAGRDVRWATRVVDLAARGEGWRLTDEGGRTEDVDLAVVALPAEQSADLLRGAAPDLASRAAASISEPCWTVMAAYPEPVVAEGDCQRGEDVLGWAARNSAKPGRTGPESWVLQATPQWSKLHLDDEPGEVTATLSATLSDMLGVDLPPPLATAAHRWRYARCAPGGPGPILDTDRRLGLCGDWLIGPRVEAAWLSGAGLAELVVS
jgi:predicted NAD/FAD-dependent oxidoreductase